MVSKNQLKLITGLHQKKYRQAENMFFAEGYKVISELLQSAFELVHVYQTEELFTEVSSHLKSIISFAELKKMTALATPNNCLAIFRYSDENEIKTSNLIVALDDVRDPGNFGTILRLCDWFGIEQILCSKETVDVYNPKVVQATMGSLARVSVNYVDLPQYLAQTNLPIFGTFMDGTDIYKTSLPNHGIIVLGNEANGISEEVNRLVTKRIAIPRFGDIQKTESLNVASAAAIVLSEFRRSSSEK